MKALPRSQCRIVLSQKCIKPQAVTMASTLHQIRPGSGSAITPQSSNTTSSSVHKVPLPRARIFRTKYTSLPVSIPPGFLSPLSSSELNNVQAEKIDFASSGLPEYTDHFAVVIDGILTADECKELIRYAEMSAGSHGNGPDQDGERGPIFEELRSRKSQDPSRDDRNPDVDIKAGKKVDGWHQALVRTGANREMLSLKHRNSDRIVWNSQEIATRIWRRVEQSSSVREYMSVLEGEDYQTVMGEGAVGRGERWKVAGRGMNESLKFLRYEPGGYFKPHCDGTYETADGSERSFYTIHLYLNGSIAATKSVSSEEGLSDLDGPTPFHNESKTSSELEGGATTFHSRDLHYKLDVHPKAGRVLIFQQKGLLHSGEDVTQGVKFTMRSDIMYEYDDGEKNEECDVIFG